MPRYTNPYIEDFKKLVYSKHNAGARFKIKVQSNPNGEGGEQILKAYINCSGDLDTFFYGQDNINGFDFKYCTSWKHLYEGTFELVDPVNPNPEPVFRKLKDMVIGDIIEDGSRSFRVAEIYGVTFSAYPTDHTWYNLTVLSFDQCETEGFVITNQKAVPEPVVEKVELPKPKFKIGDVLIYRYEGCKLATVIFKVEKITTYHDGDIFYHYSSNESHSETDLNLF